MSEAVQVQPLAKEFADIRLSAMFETLTTQRNNALNEVANVTAENAILRAALQQRSARVLELETQLQSAGILPPTASN